MSYTTCMFTINLQEKDAALIFNVCVCVFVLGGRDGVCGRVNISCHYQVTGECAGSELKSV